jgi:glucosamine--fructose-6-phosphate aminotransferase (isomerizing)
MVTTNVGSSALARAADVVVALEFGTEAAVSTKSYVTTLAAHERALGALRHADDARAVERILMVADDLAQFSPAPGAIVSSALNSPRPRLAFIANSPGQPTALIGALLVKEVAKFPAEGYLAGEFRHGPLELAGPGLTALFFGDGSPDRSLADLARELVRSGALVVQLDAEEPLSGAPWAMATKSKTSLGRLVCGAKLAQLLSAELARAFDVQPGEFRFGQKVTTSL